MKSYFMLLCLIFISSAAAATESISLYAQACLPYFENNSLYFNCASQETVRVELKDSDPGAKVGNWTKKVILGNSAVIVSLKVQKMTLASGDVSTSVEGEIDIADGVKLVFSHSNLSPDLSISLASLVAFGEKKALPHFFFGTPLNFNEKTNAAVMESALNSR